MSRFLKTQLEDGLDLFVETVETGEAPRELESLPPAEPARARREAPEESTLVKRKAAELESAVKVARSIARRVEGELLPSSEDLLSEVSLEVSLAFSAEGGIVLVGKASGSASLRLTMRWAPRDEARNMFNRTARG